MAYTIDNIPWEFASYALELGEKTANLEYDEYDIGWLTEEVDQWCDQFLKKKCEVYITYERWYDGPGRVSYDPVPHLYFENFEDYLLFKMRWIDNA